MSEVRLSSVLGPAFHLLARDAFRHGHTHYDLSGGRGSLKSSAVSLLVPPLLIHNPGTQDVYKRQRGKTQKWLESEITNRTGLFADSGYMDKILKGKRNAPKIVRAICEILDIQDSNEIVQ